MVVPQTVSHIHKVWDDVESRTEPPAVLMCSLCRASLRVSTLYTCKMAGALILQTVLGP